MGVISCKLIKILGASEKKSYDKTDIHAKASCDGETGCGLILKPSLCAFYKRKQITVRSAKRERSLARRLETKTYRSVYKLPA